MQGNLAASKWGRLAQLVEQLTLNQRVVGSNPSASTIQVIYHFVFKRINGLSKNLRPHSFPHFDLDILGGAGSRWNRTSGDMLLGPQLRDSLPARTLTVQRTGCFAVAADFWQASIASRLSRSNSAARSSAFKA